MRSGTLTVVCLALAAGVARGDSPGTAVHETPGIALASLPDTHPGHGAEETEALHVLQEDGRRTVEALTAILASLPPGPEQDRIQADVIAAKLDARERLLRAIAAFATARGDRQEAEEAERALDALRTPTIRAVVVSPATKEGGSR